MTAVAQYEAAPRFVVSAERLRVGLFWLTAFGSAIVLVEPGPFELIGLAAVAIWAGTGALRLTRGLMPIALLLVLDMTGASMALVPVIDKPDTLLWTATGWFLAVMGLFFAMALAERSLARLEALTSALIAGGSVASLLAVLGWFHVLPPADLFMLYGRARGTFDDPNVFAPFLIFPMLVLAQRVFIGAAQHPVRDAALFALMMLGLLLAFSRGAWGTFAGAAVLMTGLTFVAAGTQRLRLRILVLCIIGLVLVAVLVAGLLSVDSVGQLFQERASLGQSYDTGHFGRFNRWSLGFVLALGKPNGIGMLQFATLFGEEPHNSFLNAFMAYGWLGGIVFPAIVVSTVVVGFRSCLRPSPWRHLFICVQAAYVAQICESWVISVDHWRHLWILFGAVWGLSLATARLDAGRRTQPSPAGALPA